MKIFGDHIIKKNAKGLAMRKVFTLTIGDLIKENYFSSISFAIISVKCESVEIHSFIQVVYKSS